MKQEYLECYFCNKKIERQPDNHHPDKENNPNWTVPVHHKCHMIYHEIYPKNYSELRRLVKARNDFQEMRISFVNQLDALSRLGFSASKTQEQAKKVLKDNEQNVCLSYCKIVKNLPIWKEWMQFVYGLGLDTSGQLIAAIDDIKKFKTVSSLWSYFGYGLYNNKIQSLKGGYAHNFSCKNRAMLFKIINRGFISHKKKSYYGQLYYKFKQQYKEQHPVSIENKKGNGFKKDYTDMHIHLMSVRKVAKVFLKDIWIVWRTIDKLPVLKPYEVQYLGCSSYEIPGWNIKNNVNQWRAETQCHSVRDLAGQTVISL